ncbi:Holliday junction resolvase RuvX, partial [Candidatus Kuenenbacteria bacterium HGW-Kuenenbacteria-1]
MGKILGFDYGKSKIGLALADEQLKIALPYKTIKNKGEKNLFEELKKICKEEDVKQIIIGEPSQLTDNNQEIIMEIKLFAKKVNDFLKIPINFKDERMTTKMAKVLLKGSKIK